MADISTFTIKGTVYNLKDAKIPSWAKTPLKPDYTPNEIGAKAIQSVVSDPIASGAAVDFIDSITQNEQGVIVPTKKTVRSATQNSDGLMSASDKKKLDGIDVATVAETKAYLGIE